MGTVHVHGEICGAHAAKFLRSVGTYAIILGDILGAGHISSLKTYILIVVVFREPVHVGNGAGH
jgi:hypothetical protein